VSNRCGELSTISDFGIWYMETTTSTFAGRHPTLRLQKLKREGKLKCFRLNCFSLNERESNGQNSGTA